MTSARQLTMLAAGLLAASIATPDIAGAERARSSGRAKPAAVESAPSTSPVAKPSQPPTTDAGRLIAQLQTGGLDVPRLELAARLADAGFEATDEYKLMRETAARELTGRPDGAGYVTAGDLQKADMAIRRRIATLREAGPSFAELARLPGRPQIPGLAIVYLNPLGEPADANGWKNILVHQSEGPPGSARHAALAQFAKPSRRGVTLWVETDGAVYWSTAESTIPTHGDGGNRRDNKYIDNAKTYRVVLGSNSIGVEFVGNYPDVGRPATPQQVEAWLILVRFLQERYGIAADNIYAHNWIDMKDHRYCEGCDLATRARNLGYVPATSVAKGAQ